MFNRGEHKSSSYSACSCYSRGIRSAVYFVIICVIVQDIFNFSNRESSLAEFRLPGTTYETTRTQNIELV